MMRLALTLSGVTLCALLSGCASAEATVSTDLATAEKYLGNAVNAYGIAKGIADVAVAADPALGPLVGLIEAVVDPLIPTAQTLLANTNADAGQVTALYQQIQTQVVQLETTTAAKIKVISNGQ